MVPNFTTLKFKLKNEEKILNFVPPDLYNLKLDIQKLFNLTDQQIQNLEIYAKPIILKGTTIEIKLESSNDYNVFVLDQQKFADLIVIRCKLNEKIKNEENKDKIINNLKKRINNLENENKYLIKKNNDLINKYNICLSNLKEIENENNLLKENSEDKDKIISKLNKSIFQQKTQSCHLLYLFNKNHLKLNFKITTSLKEFYNQYLIDNNLNLDYNYEFIENNSSINTKKEEIIKDKKIFDFYFKIKNIGANWPTDTLLKCIPDDSTIYFFHLKITDGVWSYSDENYPIYVFPVKILFKNYNKFNKINKLSCYLLSDRYGKIGNKIGKMEIIIKDY